MITLIVLLTINIITTMLTLFIAFFGGRHNTSMFSDEYCFIITILAAGACYYLWSKFFMLLCI